MYFVYFLKSQTNGDLYIGSCEDTEARLSQHNSGKVKSTKGYMPWKMVGFEEYTTRSEAFRKEQFYKSGQQRELLKKKYA